MFKIFGYRFHFGPSNEKFAHPANTLKSAFDTRLKRLLNPAVDPKLQELFKDIEPLPQKKLQPNHFTYQPSELMPNAAQGVKDLAANTLGEKNAELNFNNAAETILLEQEIETALETAETANDIAETTLIEEGGEAILSPTKTAKRVIEETSAPATPFSKITTLTTATLQAIPGKLFFLTMLPFLFFYQNKDNIQTNIHIHLKLSQKKLVVIKLGLGNLENRLAFVVSPRRILNFVSEYNQTPVAKNTHPFPSMSTSFFWNYVVAPLTLWTAKRVEARREYYIQIEDPSNPSLIQNPVTFTFPISSDQSIHITQVFSHTLQNSFASDKVQKVDSSYALNKVNTFVYSFGDSPGSEESVQKIPLSKFLDTQTSEYITVVQRPL